MLSALLLMWGVHGRIVCVWCKFGGQCAFRLNYWGKKGTKRRRRFQWNTLCHLKPIGTREVRVNASVCVLAMQRWRSCLWVRWPCEKKPPRGMNKCARADYIIARRRNSGLLVCCAPNRCRGLNALRNLHKYLWVCTRSECVWVTYAWIFAHLPS